MSVLAVSDLPVHVAMLLWLELKWINKRISVIGPYIVMDELAEQQWGMRSAENNQDKSVRNVSLTCTCVAVLLE